MPTVSIVGLGRMGGALAIALDRAEVRVERIVTREKPPSDAVLSLLSNKPAIDHWDGADTINSDVVLIATRDPEIELAFSQIAGRLAGTRVVQHLSGSLGSQILDKALCPTISVGSLHPLVSISEPVIGADSFAGSYFCVEGEPAAVEMGEQLSRLLGGIPFSIPTELKALYHAAAVTSAGHVVALFDVAIELMAACGLDRTMARKVLLPLLSSTVNNLRQQDTGPASTGSYSRGDIGALARHTAAIGGASSPDVLRLFLLLAERTASIAEDHDERDNAESDGLRNAINVAKRNVGW